MKDAKKKEIRRVLLGKAVLATDGRLIAVPAGTFMKTPIGIGDGANAVRFFGMSRRVRRYETKDSRARVAGAAKTAMQNIGRGLILNEQPEATACLIRYILTRPAVLVFTWEDGVPTLSAWTGRGLTGWISLRRAIRAFEKGLPESMTAADYKPPKEKKEKKPKTEKKQKKEKKPKGDKAPASEQEKAPASEQDEAPEAQTNGAAQAGDTKTES